MAKGITAFIVVLALTMSMSIMSGLGAYEALGVGYGESQNDDVAAAENALVGQQASDQASGSVLEDFTTSAGQTLSTFWQIIANLSGILQLLFGLPAVLTDTLQTFFQMVFGITFAAFIRGVILQ